MSDRDDPAPHSAPQGEAGKWRNGADPRDAELAALREELAVAREHLHVFSQLTSGYWWLGEVRAEGLERRAWTTRSFARSTGYTAEDIGSVDVEALVHSEDVTGFRTSVNSVVRGPAQAGRDQAVHEFRMFARDGSLMWVRQRLEGRGQGLARRVYASGELITERKRTEDALGHVEARFLSLVEHAPNVILTSDLDGTILFINRRMPGDSREPWELIGSSMFELTDEVGAARIRHAVAEIITAGGERDYSAQPISAWEFELRGRPGDEAPSPAPSDEANEGGPAPGVEGSRWYEAQAAPVIRSREIVAITMILSDITERRRAEQALRRSESRWRFLWENVPDRITELDAEGRIVVTNRAIGRAPAASSFGSSIFDHLGPEACAALRRAMDLATRSGEPSSYEIVVREPEIDPRTGQRGETWWANRVVPYVEGEARGFLLIGTNISDRKAAERERTNLEAQLRQQQKLESLGTLASGVAHEINNPIQGIMNYAELIGGSPVADDEIREYADEIEHETRRVATIVRNLLAFSRQEGEKSMVETTIPSIVEGTLSLIHAVLRKDQIRLQIELPDDLPAVHCRAQQIQQVIMNLVTNARDALNARWPTYHEDKRIDIIGHAFERGDVTWVRISVVDHGGGIPLEVVPRIFDPFFTTKGRDQGTGLGLAVSHGIIAEHGGELRLDNRFGTGAVFHVELPCRRAWAAA